MSLLKQGKKRAIQQKLNEIAQSSDQHKHIMDVMQDILHCVLSYFDEGFVSESVEKTIRLYGGRISFLDTKTRTLYDMAWAGYLDHRNTPHHYPYGQGVLWVPIIQERHQLVQNVKEDEGWLNLFAVAKDTKTQSALLFRIASGNLVVGVLQLTHCLPNGFDQDDLDFVASLIPMVQLLIAHFSYLKSESRTRIFLELARSVQSEENFEDVIRLTFTEIDRYFINEKIYGYLFLWDENGHLLHMNGRTYNSPIINEDLIKEILASVQVVSQTRKPRFFDNTHNEPQATNLASVGYGSVLFLPIWLDKKDQRRNVGGICMVTQRSGIFNLDDANFLMKVMLQVGATLEQIDLRRRSIALGTLSYMTTAIHAVTHQITQPIAGVRGNVMEISRKINEGNVDINEILSLTNTSRLLIKTLFDEVLSYREVFGNKEEVLEVYEIIEGLQKAKAEALPLRKNNLNITIADNLPQVLVRGNYSFTSSFRELMINADKYSYKEPGNLHIYFEISKQDVIIYFKDDGIGFNPSDAERIFIAGQRTAEGKKVAEGWGIGLPGIRLRLTVLGGTISAHSNGHNEGTTFIVTIPRQDHSGFLREE